MVGEYGARMDFDVSLVSLFCMPHPGSSVVSVSDSQPGGCEFDTRSPLQKHGRKEVGGFGKKSCVSTGLRKPVNTCGLPTP